MPTRLATDVRNSMVTSWATAPDAGAGPGYVQIRSGTQPLAPSDAATGTLLGTLTFSDPAFASAANGTVSVNAITGDTSADATGTASWFRVFDSNGVAKWDGECSESGGSGQMVLNSVNIIAGGTINITAWTLTQPAS